VKNTEEMFGWEWVDYEKTDNNEDTKLAKP
jgi:hypothetical protein